MHGFGVEARSGDIPVDYNKLRNSSCLGLINWGQKSVSNGDQCQSRPYYLDY
jgi:hypothetical protein